MSKGDDETAAAPRLAEIPGLPLVGTVASITEEMMAKGVEFDFEIDSHRGKMKGQKFRLDIEGSDISDRELAARIVKDLHLLTEDNVHILNRNMIFGQHQRRALEPDTGRAGKHFRFIDLSHLITDGLITYKGFPAPVICDYMSREQSKVFYDENTSFQIGKIEMIANTGTYIDSPFHRFQQGADVSELELSGLADLEAVVVRAEGVSDRAVDREVFVPIEVTGKAVLVHTGWARYWATDRYFEGHSFLTEAAAIYLKEHRAALVGIDSLNIDDISGGARPVHTTLLGAGIPIVEHLCNLDQLPMEPFTFTAVPVKIKGMGSFPVRAFAKLRDR